MTSLTNAQIQAAQPERFDKLIELGWGSEVEDIFFMLGGNSSNMAEVLDYIISLGKQVRY